MRSLISGARCDMLPYKSFINEIRKPCCASYSVSLVVFTGASDLHVESCCMSRFAGC